MLQINYTKYKTKQQKIVVNFKKTEIKSYTYVCQEFKKISFFLIYC